MTTVRRRTAGQRSKVTDSDGDDEPIEPLDEQEQQQVLTDLNDAFERARTFARSATALLVLLTSLVWLAYPLLLDPAKERTYTSPAQLAIALPLALLSITLCAVDQPDSQRRVQAAQMISASLGFGALIYVYSTQGQVQALRWLGLVLTSGLATLVSFEFRSSAAQIEELDKLKYGYKGA